MNSVIVNNKNNIRNINVNFSLKISGYIFIKLRLLQVYIVVSICSRVSQLWPVQPAAQLQVPVTWSQLDCLAQRQCSRQFTPHLPSAHAATSVSNAGTCVCRLLSINQSINRSVGQPVHEKLLRAGPTSTRPAWQLTALPNPLVGFEGPLRGGEREGKWKQGRGNKRKEMDRRDERTIPRM